MQNAQTLTQNFVLDFARSKRKVAKPKNSENTFRDEFVLDRSDTPESRLLANKTETAVTDNLIAPMAVTSFAE